MGLLKTLGIGKYLKKVKDYTDEQIENLVGTAPETLDTIHELAEAIKDNDTIIDALNGAITDKASKSELNTEIAKIEEIIVDNEKVTAGAIVTINKALNDKASKSDLEDIIISGGGASIIEITYTDLKSLRDNSKLVPGTHYRITDYVTTTTQENTQSAGHQFDVIVTADNENTLNEVARACMHDGDNYFSEAGANLAAWQIWYSLDNDTDRFAWAAPADGKIRKVSLVKYGYSNYTAYHDASRDTEVNGKKLYAWNQGGGPGQTGYSDTLDITSESKVYTSSGEEDTSASFLVEVKDVEKGKGVIYRMIDEWLNDVPYDFKNIQYSVNSQLVYTFANADDVKGGCYCNEVKPYRVRGAQKLNNIRFDGNCYNNSFGNDCSDNSFGNGCYSNSFGTSCSYNSFGNNCYGNSFGTSCSYNSFGNNCYGNSFGNGCGDNSFGNGCGDNSFGNGCYSNSFGTSCSYNSFGNNCYGNSFGNGCYSNSFGTSCYGNSFGSDGSNNSFGTSCSYNSFRTNNSITATLLNYCRYNHFDDGCSYNIVYNTTTTGSNNQLQNVNINRGVSGTSSKYNTISIDTLNANYEIQVAKNSSGDIKIYCEADLIA